MRAPARIGIIGGGFSGAMVAVQLARQATMPLAMEIVEPRPLLGGGVAYSAADPSHRINVPAARMTVFADDPTQFDRWLRASGLLAGDADAIWPGDFAFPQRGVFGRYIAELVDQAAAMPGVSIQHHATRVIDVIAHPAGFSLQLQTGGWRDVDVLVLAVSHPPPGLPAPLRDVVASGGPVIVDPWAAGALEGIPPHAEVLIVGTALSMADVVATLDRRGHTGGIVAVSRRGLLSRGHVFLPDDVGWQWCETADPHRRATGLVRAVRVQVARAAAAGLPWQVVFDDVRRHAGRVWSALPEAEQRRIVRHVRPFWDVHRFRVAPQLVAAIERRRAAGQFTVMAASLQGARWDGVGMEVQLRARGARGDAVMTHRCDVVVNTTGPDHRSALRSNPALAALLRQGLLCADGVGLGLEVDAASHAVGADGASRDDLLISGPLARGRFGELMGLPQVSEHAAFVAGTIVARLACGVAARGIGAADAAE